MSKDRGGGFINTSSQTRLNQLHFTQTCDAKTQTQLKVIESERRQSHRSKEDPYTTKQVKHTKKVEGKAVFREAIILP